VQALRPDIVPTPTDRVEVRVVGGHERLYLSFETENAGLGPLEVQPVQEDCDDDGSTKDDRTGVQHIYGDTDGSGEYTPGTDTVVRNVVVGCFVYHAIHQHWHFQNYARYRLESLDGDRLRANSKVGFCMLDSISVDPGLPGYQDARVYTGCPDLATQGISVGWADIYSIDTPGQFIRIDGVANGIYCLIGVADPANQILETDEHDNEIRTRVRLADLQATIRPAAC
jgi:hypothetical protein